MNNKGNLKISKIFVIILVIIFIIYLSYIMYLLLSNKSDTFIVNEGTLYKEETVVGYIVRNEELVTNEGEVGEILPIAAEKQKVAKGESVFQYYNLNQDDIKNKINEIDLKLQENLKTESINQTSEIKLLENQIESILQEINKETNLQEISEYNKEIDSLLEKKISFIGTSSNTDKAIKELISERQKYENQLSDNAIYAKAPVSGIVSYRVDGLENELSIENVDKLSMEKLDELKIKTGQMITSSQTEGKVIDNFKNYLLTESNSEEAKNAKVGDSLKIRLSTNDEVEAKVYYKREENNKILLVFEIDKMTEKLTEYRKISFDVIWWSNTGLKVPNQAILTDEKGLNYVIREKSGYNSKVLVKVDKSNTNYSIVSTYTAKELAEKGCTQEEISSSKKIRLYDEILTNPSADKAK